jgi:hypothetical protein
VDLCAGALPPALVHNPDAAMDYVVDCALELTGATSVGPGVVIGFTPSGYLTLRGASLVGTEQAPIRLIPESPGAPWRGVEVFGKLPSTLERVQVVGAGAPTAIFEAGAALRVGAFVFDEGAVSIRDCVFDSSASTGISFGVGGKASKFEGVTVKNAKGFPVEATPDTLGALAGPGNSLVGNGIDAILILDSSTPAGAFTWPRLSIPYRVTTPLPLHGSHTIEPGVRIEMDKGAGLSVTNTEEGPASLSAQGTKDAVIEIQGLSGKPGGWSGIFLQGGSLSLSQVKLSGGGAFPDAKPSGMVLADPNSDGSTVEIRDCVLEASSGFAIVLNGAKANPDIAEANVFLNNALGNVAP